VGLLMVLLRRSLVLARFFRRTALSRLSYWNELSGILVRSIVLVFFQLGPQYLIRFWSQFS
jgi:hypothetical protein